MVWNHAMKKLSSDVVTLATKPMDISYLERKPFPAAFLPGKV